MKFRECCLTFGIFKSSLHSVQFFQKTYSSHHDIRECKDHIFTEKKWVDSFNNTLHFGPHGPAGFGGYLFVVVLPKGPSVPLECSPAFLPFWFRIKPQLTWEKNKKVSPKRSHSCKEYDKQFFSKLFQKIIWRLKPVSQKYAHKSWQVDVDQKHPPTWHGRCMAAQIPAWFWKTFWGPQDQNVHPPWNIARFQRIIWSVEDGPNPYSIYSKMGLQTVLDDYLNWSFGFFW